MKKISVILFILIGINHNSLSQVAVNKISDIDSVIQNKGQYTNRPFSFLINNIHLEIKKVRAYPAGHTSVFTDGIFQLYFVDHSEYDSLIRLKIISPNIIVHVKEDFVWKPKISNWNKLDAYMYGNLTVIDISKN
jgi:hypothetical protein